MCGWWLIAGTGHGLQRSPPLRCQSVQQLPYFIIHLIYIYNFSFSPHFVRFQLSVFLPRIWFMFCQP
ncbi:hypothetical protein GDO78_000445 [Eleutherodactylus coqui]|uniref:Uncharacterized protein n=1 Tax=Eleutherodactylus coqui TaxID=57060 RepID=A0A8J6KFF8_ELECQ|nr:hypothetical protein GDO78_000445 [Eleutherodactylus coqui]